MEKARDEKERIKMITERGIPASTATYQPSTNTVATSSNRKRNQQQHSWKKSPQETNSYSNDPAMAFRMSPDSPDVQGIFL